MKVQKTTFLQKQLMLLLFLFSAGAFAQAPTFSNYAPSVVTHRTPVTITGSGFTGVTSVKFNNVSATSFTVVSATSIKAVLPEITAIAAGTTGTVSVSVVKSGTTTTASSRLSYVAPAATPSNARVSRIVTNYNGYYVSSAATTNPALMPDNSHSLMAFTYNGTQYSTGPTSEVGSVLGGANAATTGAYTQGNFRALPINNIAGNAGGSTSSDPNLIILGKQIDGSANTAVPTATNVRGLTVRDVLIDGIRGLDLGTGVTNLPSSSVLSFQASNIISGVVDDSTPDIVVSQVASPNENSYDVFCFVDASGNIVGRPVQINIYNVAPVGTYKMDLFTLPGGTPLATATVNGTTRIGDTRDIRLVAYRLADFGITEANRTEAVQFVVMPSGTSDPAFMSYNRNSFQIPAPEIRTQPSSVAVCPGPGTSASFTVTLESTAVGTENPTFVWEKDGVVLQNGNGISGATTATLTVSPVTAGSAGEYTVVVSNASGAVRSMPATLNTVLVSATSTTGTSCSNAAADSFVEVGAAGLNTRYQWYAATSATNNTNGTLIPGATTARYAPVVPVNTTHYYYAKAYPNGFECAAVTSPVLEYRMNGVAAGTANGATTICAGNSVQLTLSNAMGNIQWEKSATGTGNWVNVTGGLGANTNTYSTDLLSTTTYFRAKVTFAECEPTYSNSVKVTVNETTNWTGAVDIYWNTPGNWSCGTVPTIFTKVFIPAAPANQPNVIGLTGRAKDITVQNGARVTVLTAGSLQVVNNINVATGGFFTVENNASLIQDNSAIANTGVIKVNRNTNSLFKLDYTLWSAPVTGQQLQSFSPATLSNRFYEYKFVASPTTSNPNAGTELYSLVDPSVTNFTPAKAFLIRMPNALDGDAAYNAGSATRVFQGVFTGTPINGTVTYPLSQQGARFTAIGNPYASPISVTDFYNANNGVLDGQSAIYFWRKKNNTNVSSYASLTMMAYTANTARSRDANNTPTPGYTSGGQMQAPYYAGGNNASWRISQGQGFFVKAKANVANPVITFTNSMRREAPANGDQAFFRTGRSTTSRLWLNLAGNTEDSFSQIAVGYTEGATLGLDYGYDGTQYGENEAVSLYTIAENTKLVIQARPEFTTTDIVPVGFKAATAGNLTIALDHFDGVFEDGQNIYLKDNTTNAVHDLRTGDYAFATEAGTFNDRFEVMYTTEALGTTTPALTANNVIIYKDGSSININAGTAELTDVTVYDVRGRVLFTKSGLNGTTTVVSGLQAAQEVLIVEVNTVKGKVSKKIVF